MAAAPAGAAWLRRLADGRAPEFLLGPRGEGETPRLEIVETYTGRHTVASGALPALRLP